MPLNQDVYELIATAGMKTPDIPVFAVRYFGQCAEDIIVLAIIRALCAREGLDAKRERYLEIGANHPVSTSATYLLHETIAMTGVLVEANPYLIDDLRRFRPHDIVVHGAIQTNDVNVVDLFISNHDEISSLHRSFVTEWLGGTVGECGVDSVPALRINDVIREHFPDRAPVFLSLDIEGMDLAVLSDLDLRRVRPALIQIEPSEHYHPGNSRDITVHLEGMGYIVAACTDVNLLAVDATRFALTNDTLKQELANMRDALARVSALRAQESREFKATLLRCEGEHKDALDIAKLEMARSNERNLALHEELQRVREALNESEKRLAEAREAHAQMRALHEELQRVHGALSESERRLGEARGRHAQAVDKLHHLETSTFWRATGPLRRVAGRMPVGLRFWLRRLVKVAWWLATPHLMSYRLEFLRLRARTLPGRSVGPKLLIRGGLPCGAYVPPGRAHFVATDARTLFARLAQLDVLSLDIFDTALLRRVADPTTVFSLVEAADPGFAGFADLRVWAELEARRLATKAGRSPEIGLDEIYDVVARKLQLSAADRVSLQTLELQSERQVLVANPVVLNWYERARALAKRVIFVSDMYLPATFLAEVLEAAGYANPEVYVSNTYGVGKWQKTLFGEVAKGCGVSGGRILHLGDNAQSDRDCADAAGWNGFQYAESEAERPFALQLASSDKLDLGNVAVSVGLGLARTHRLHVEAGGEPFADRFARHVGYEVVGPTVLAFAGWVATQAVMDRLDRVLFLARDGFLPQRVYDMIRARGCRACEARYILASRRMLYSRLYATEEEVRAAASRIHFSRETTTLADYLDIFLLSEEEVRRCAEIAGVADIHAPVLQQLSRKGDYAEAHCALSRIIAGITRLVMSKAREVAKLQDEYYREAAAVDGACRVGLIDLGWAGSIIEPLRRIFADIAGGAEIRAYFLGLNSDSRRVIPPSVRWRTYFFDNVWPRQPFPGEIPTEAHNVLYASIALVEALISENCTTAIGLVRDETSGAHCVRPVFASDTYKDSHRRFLRLVHEEAEAFARDAILLLPASPGRWDFRPLLSHAWNRVLSSPDEEEARLLASLTHRIDASGRPAVTSLVVSGVASGSSLLDRFRASMWPAGFFALLNPDERAQLLAEADTRDA